MKILYIGNLNGGSKPALKAIKKIYNSVDFLDTSNIFKNKYLYYIFYHINPNFLNNKIFNFYRNNIYKKYDLVLFYNVDLINIESINEIKKKSKKIFFFCADNPFVSRDKLRWLLFKKCLKKFDLIIAHNRSREKYFKKNKLKNYIITLPAYSSNIHKTYKNNTKKKEIAFIGTWFPERGRFFYELKKLGMKFDIYGGRWSKDKKYYKFLKTNYKGNLNYQDVGKKMNKYKINIALLSKENDDDITRRCIEIPASGSLLCSEKTKTLSFIFKDNIDAVFFETAKECFEKCNNLLNDESLIKKITKNGHNKITNILKPEVNKIFMMLLNLDLKKIKKNKFIYKY